MNSLLIDYVHLRNENKSIKLLLFTIVHVKVLMLCLKIISELANNSGRKGEKIT